MDASSYAGEKDATARDAWAPRIVGSGIGAREGAMRGRARSMVLQFDGRSGIDGSEMRRSAAAT
jgi:hypothetical protein